MREHLTQEDIEKYVNIDEQDPVYLEWFEEAEMHVLGCKRCQELIKKQMMINMICAPDGELLNVGLKALSKEININKPIPFGGRGGFGGNGGFVAASIPAAASVAYIPTSAASTNMPAASAGMGPASVAKDEEKDKDGLKEKMRQFFNKKNK